MTVRYIDFEGFLSYHSEIMAAHGQQSMLISEERLRAALARPAASAFGVEVFPSLVEKAAAVLHSIVSTHPFVDGNKRAGLAALLIFLELNGLSREADDDALYDLILGVARGDANEIPVLAKRLAALFPSLEEPG